MDMQTSFLQITYKSEIVNGEPIFISSNALPFKASNYEPAGLSFHLAALKLSGYDKKEDSDTDDQSVKSDDKDQTYMPSAESYSTKTKKKGDGSKQQDHYALLGLGHLRFLATEDQIKKCYRETALRHHPDKQASLLLLETTEQAKQKKKDEIESHFKSIQEAYEVLIDPNKRRIYDSTDEFDDDIPTTCAPHDFFKVFGPALMRNGKWSVTQPVPALGDDQTPLKEVDSFYDFWYVFKSWREFPHADEHDLEEAESRDEKRWMERQNAKLREKARKEEHARVRNLVDNAYKRDPRIRGRKEAEKAEKTRKKEAKLMAKRMQEEEAARAVEEEKRRREEEEKKAAEAASIQKKQKEKEKKLLRKERSRLRALSSNFAAKNSSSGISADDLEGLCMSLNMENIKRLCDDMETLEENGRIKQLEVALREGNSYAATEPKANGVPETEPKANGNAAADTKQAAPLSISTGRPVEEIPKATKTVLLQKPDPAKAFESFLNGNGGGLKAPAAEKVELSSNGDSGDQEAWSGVQEKALVQAAKTFPKEDPKRWERIAASIPGRSVVQCRKKFASMKESFRGKKGSD